MPVREAENQPRRKPSDTASKVIVDLQECNTDTDNAAKQQRANENQDGVLKEVIRPIAMNESGDRVSITNIGQREGDELDSIVAEVQDTAELVKSPAINHSCDSADLSSSLLTRRMTASHQHLTRIAPIRKVADQQNREERSEKGSDPILSIRSTNSRA